MGQGLHPTAHLSVREWPKQRRSTPTRFRRTDQSRLAAKPDTNADWSLQSAQAKSGHHTNVVGPVRLHAHVVSGSTGPHIPKHIGTTSGSSETHHAHSGASVHAAWSILFSHAYPRSAPTS